MNTNHQLPAQYQNRPLMYQEETRQIIGAAMEVHNQLGCGFLEGVYQEALERELALRGIPFVSQHELKILYKGVQLSKTYIADLIVDSKIIVELKAMDGLTSREESQLLNYLKATRISVGMLINFGGTRLEWKRRISTFETSQS